MLVASVILTIRDIGCHYVTSAREFRQRENSGTMADTGKCGLKKVLRTNQEKGHKTLGHKKEIR